jgi:alkylation response protein AidB-like acyl-CoA dehydrogenase
VTVHLEYTDDQRALRDRVRARMAELMTPALCKELETSDGGGPEYRRALEALGADGWLGLGWPVAYGGQGRGSFDEFIFFDEVQRAGFPIPLLTLNTVGPTLVHYGTEAQKARYLPEILRGRLHFSIGYTEPSAGTDLAALRTTARRDGDHYVINGQKIWNSMGGFADALWLACRTHPDAPRHKGISVIIVPMDTPGISKTPMQALGDNDVWAIYLDDVRVPVENLVGPEHGGWRLITTQLNHERVALVSVGLTERLIDETRAWATEARGDGGGRLIDEPWVGLALARAEVSAEVLRLMNHRQAWSLERGQVDPADASAIKVYGSERYIDVYRALMEILGSAGTLRAGSPGAALAGKLERVYRASLVLTFGGGTNEIQRDIIATAGLGLPRARR